MEHNWPAWLDYLLLKGHSWRPTWDPEGILSTFPAVVTCQAGIFAAAFLLKKREEKDRITWLFVVANFVLFLALVWDLFFPINKGLWTSSYVLYTAGLAIIVFLLLYWMLDIKKKIGEKAFFPFIVLGVNPITAYVLSIVLAKVFYLIKVPAGGQQKSLYQFLYEDVFSSIFHPMNASLAFSLFFLGVFIFLPLLWMYKRKIIVKI